ncbi:DUF58 domain-containing protein [Bacillus mesophilum]|uniref:DUF58 domain-containing protein n=1 Tax=Bacillus mesophilum TaxID=1071718 RepID=A0A7V7RPJ8_9BACI|nr:DUF58 domain-containing protein [Bacillus mesophilum]KAB2335220.1 DUF58 domain-containing protein [Bacillus mesophilum]
MKQWRKYTVEDHYFSVTGLIAIILFFASLYFHSWPVFFAAVMFIILSYSNAKYLKLAGKKLIFHDQKRRDKFFPEESGEWVLHFENQGVPILKGELLIYFDDVVSPSDETYVPRLSIYEISIPFSINFRHNNIIKIPFIARNRGMAKIRKMEIHIPHFFGLGETVLEYNQLMMQEALVYPQTLNVKNKNALMTDRQGESETPYSLFEDLLAPAGTRDYNRSDSFNRIHWKASARKQVLQTKIFDKVAETGWNLSINISDRHSITGEIEELLKSTADLAYYFVQKNIPFSLCINIRKAGNTPFYYIAAGTGKEHLQKVLEMLALVDTHGSIYPYEKMLSFYSRHLSVQPFFLHGGREPKYDDSLQALVQRGVSIYDLLIQGENAAIHKKTIVKRKVVLS